MNKKIPASVLDNLIDKAIISESEQRNIELGHALRSITPEQLRSILFKEETLADSVPCFNEMCYSNNILLSREETECDDSEFENTLERMSHERLRSIKSLEEVPVKRSDASSPSHTGKNVPFRRLVRARIMWAASIAVLLIIAFPIVNHISRTSKNAGEITGKCEMLYAYNIEEIPDLSAGVKGDDLKDVPDITNLSKSQLEKEMPGLIRIFSNSEELQDVDIYGRILVMAYLRLDEPAKAKEILTIMVSRLSSEPEDYEETINWCKKIISQLQ